MTADRDTLRKTDAANYGRRESRRKTVPVRFEPGDLDLIDSIVDRLGLASRSEAVRTAIRGYAPMLDQVLSKRR